MRKYGIIALSWIVFAAAAIHLSPPGKEFSINIALSADEITGYDQYAGQQLGISLTKPRNWNVFVSNGIIFVKQSQNSSTGIFLFPILRADPKMEAVSFIRFMHDQALSEHPDLKIEERRSNRNNTVAEVTARYTSKISKEVIRGFYLVSIEGGRGLFSGYEAPAGSFDRNHTILRTVLKNLKVAPVTFYNAARSSQPQAGDRAYSKKSMAPTIDINKLTVKLSHDRTAVGLMKAQTLSPLD